MLRRLWPIPIAVCLAFATGAPAHAGSQTKTKVKTSRTSRSPKRVTRATPKRTRQRRLGAFLKPQRVKGYRIRLTARRYFKRHGIRSYALSSSKKKAAMGEQIIEVRRFVRQLARDLGESPNRYFNEVVLVPRAILGDNMRLEGGQLLIGVEVGLVRGRVKVQNAFALRRAWASGEAWEPGSLARKYWSVLDPAGTRRRAARQLLGDLRGRFDKRIKGLPRGRGKAEQLRRGLRELVLESAAGADSEETRAVRERALRVIAGASQKKLSAIARRWKTEVESADNIEDATEAAARQQYLSDWDIEIDNGAGGFIFNNMKRIRVGVGRMGRFLDKPQRSETRIRIRQKRGIIIQPNDDVQVEVGSLDVARAALRALQIHSLERALDAGAP